MSPLAETKRSSRPEPLASLAGAPRGQRAPVPPSPSGSCPSFPALPCLPCPPPPAGALPAAPSWSRGAAAGRTSRAGTGARPVPGHGRPPSKGSSAGRGERGNEPQGVESGRGHSRLCCRRRRGCVAAGGTHARSGARSGAFPFPAPSLPLPHLAGAAPSHLGCSPRCMQLPERRSPGGYAGCVGIH